MSSSSSTESIWSGGIDSQGQKLDYAQGQKHATLRSQPASGSREAESKRGDSGDPQNPAPLSSEEESNHAGEHNPQPEPEAAEPDSEADGEGDQPARALTPAGSHTSQQPGGTPSGLVRSLAVTAQGPLQGRKSLSVAQYASVERRGEQQGESASETANREREWPKKPGGCASQSTRPPHVFDSASSASPEETIVIL